MPCLLHIKHCLLGQPGTPPHSCCTALLCHLPTRTCCPAPLLVALQNVQAVLLPYTRGTTLHNVYLRMLGAVVAPDAVVDAEDVSEFDLVELQQGCFVGGNTVISPAARAALRHKQVRWLHVWLHGVRVADGVCQAGQRVCRHTAALQLAHSRLAVSL